MITSSSIDTVRDADIVQVIQHYVELKKSGSNYKGLSPFVTEKSPSFMVSPGKQIFKDFASGNGGDALKFVMLHEQLDFIGAVRKIASICNITLEEEEVTEEVKAKINRKEQLCKIIDRSASLYTTTLSEQPETHWAKQMLNSRGFNEDILNEFQIGYAPANHTFLAKPLIEKALVSQAKAVGIIKVKDQRTYDFFYDRIIFPIHNHKGQIISFGGRRNNDEESAKFPKYLNLGDTELYNKSNVLYGLFQAKHAISKAQNAVLVEGYTDVVSLHQNNCDTAVASCGTALTITQLKLLSRFTPSITLFLDGDAAGQRAALKDIDLCLKADLKVKVCVCPEDEDPDTLSKKVDDINMFIANEAKDAVLWKTRQLSNKAANDPDAKADAVKEVSEMLMGISNDIKRNEYLKLCAKELKVKITDLKTAVQLTITKAEQKAEAGNQSKEVIDHLNLPDGADWQEFKNHRFVTASNCHWFQGSNGFFKGTNFTISALFHIYGKQDNKRLCELRNTEGQLRLIDFESKDFVNFSSFQEKCIDEGFYIFLPEISTIHFKLLTQRVLNDFITAYELKTLGWQTEKFFAFADGVLADNVFKPVNQYGIIQVDTDNKTDSEYQQDVKHFYSPAFSEIYKHSRDDDDPYENDRAFVYKKSPVPLEDWMAQMTSVYDKKGITAIAFAFSTVFRDFILSRYHFFPHLFLTGEKGSGKSKFGDSIANLFTFKLEPFDLNSGTLVGFYRRLARIRNVPAFFEEYHDKIDDRMFQSLKGAYDGRGREKGQATSDNRTTISKVNSSCILAGQYLSSRDDNSLTSRSVIEHFIKRQDPFTNDQIIEYNKLKSMEEQGLSSLVLEIVKYRPKIEAQFHKTYATITKSLIKDLKGMAYEERMLQNYSCMLGVLQVLWPYFQFPFTWDDVYQQFKNAILDTSDLITESEGLAEFWRVLPILERKGEIRDGHEFYIDEKDKFTYHPKKNESKVYESNPGDKILFLRLSHVHQYYHNEVSRREGVDVIGEQTMRNYFKSKRYYIGPITNYKFYDAKGDFKSQGSCYAFNYTMMQKSGIINLDSTTETEINSDDPFAPDNADQLSNGL